MYFVVDSEMMHNLANSSVSRVSGLSLIATKVIDQVYFSLLFYQ